MAFNIQSNRFKQKIKLSGEEAANIPPPKELCWVMEGVKGGRRPGLEPFSGIKCSKKIAKLQHLLNPHQKTIQSNIMEL